MTAVGFRVSRPGDEVLAALTNHVSEAPKNWPAWVKSTAESNLAHHHVFSEVLEWLGERVDLGLRANGEKIVRLRKELKIDLSQPTTPEMREEMAKRKDEILATDPSSRIRWHFNKIIRDTVDLMVHFEGEDQGANMVEFKLRWGDRFALQEVYDPVIFNIRDLDFDKIGELR